jgi:hypothetical protein
MKNRMKKKRNIILLIVFTLNGMFSVVSGQTKNDLIKINSDLSNIISTRSFFNPTPGATAQQEWLQAGCEVNFKVVASKQDDKVLIEFHFMLADLGGVSVEPTGNGGFTIRINSVDGTKRIPKLSEIIQNGVVVKRIPSYVDHISFMLQNRDDAYNVSDMLRTAINACP